MGSAVWEFMWCLDKVTRIDKDGKGWILGGKPIKLEEVGMGLSRDGVSKNLHRLEEQGYIQIIRTPYGLSLRVNKVKKRFGKNTTSLPKRDTDKTSNQGGQNLESLRQKTESNKTIQLDKTVDTTKAGKPAGFNPLGSEIIKAFEEVDPKNKTYYANKTQRAAADHLISEYGLEAVLKRIGVLPKTNKIKYFPTINSPNDLKEKWVKLQDAVSKMREEKITKQTPNYII